MTVTVHRIGGMKSGTWYFEGVGELPDCRTEVTHLISVPDGSLVCCDPSGRWFCAVAQLQDQFDAAELVALAESRQDPRVFISSTIV